MSRPATVLDIEVPEPTAKHAITMMGGWLEGASTSPSEGVQRVRPERAAVDGDEFAQDADDAPTRE